MCSSDLAIVLAEEIAGMDAGGRTFLELGCGLGLPSLVARRVGFRATATDYEETALEGVRYAAARNGIADLATRVVDWRCPPEDLGTFDLVVAANVLHATPDVRRSLRHAKSLLRPGGLLLLNEIARAHLFTHLTFGLLEGWWLYEDAELRLPGCPALAAEGWRQIGRAHV